MEITATILLTPENLITTIALIEAGGQCMMII